MCTSCMYVVWESVLVFFTCSYVCYLCGTVHNMQYVPRTTRIIVLLLLLLVCILYLSYFTSLPGFLLSVYVFSPIFQLTTHVPLHCVVSFSLSTVSTFASVTGIGGAATAVLDGLISIGGLVS